MKKAVFIPKKLVEDSLSQIPVNGKNRLNPFFNFSTQNQLPVIIFENHNVGPGNAEAMIHEKFGELFLCIQGVTTFITGGTLQNPVLDKDDAGNDVPGEWRGVKISGGDIIILREGDSLWIPADVPHQQICSRGTSRVFRIKIPA